VRKESYIDVKIRFPTANGVTPAAPRPHSPAVSLGYINVAQDNVMSSHLNVHKWYVLLSLACVLHYFKDYSKNRCLRADETFYRNIQNFSEILTLC
jgi:hypothetical protein